MKKLKNSLLIAVLAIFSITLNCGAVLADNSTDQNSPAASILLAASDNSGLVTWAISNAAAQGVRVNWSKVENPVYPTRYGDHSYYSTIPAVNSYKVTGFLGDGAYFVRACLLIAGLCSVYSNQVTVQIGVASTAATTTISNAALTNIVLWKGNEPGMVGWNADGISSKGFEVVWSNIENPSYPMLNSGSYAHLENQQSGSVIINAFNGTGNYFVRICQNLGGACGIYSNEIEIPLISSPAAATSTANAPKTEIETINDNAQKLFNNNLADILGQINASRDTSKEKQTAAAYWTSLTAGLKAQLSTSSTDSIINFITYGVDANTQKLGQGERAAVIFSYKQAYGKLPVSAAELTDAIKIANGRWPSAVSASSETQALVIFKKIYLRDANLNNAHDAAAIKVMAYGLRQQAKNRSLNSEAAAIKTYKAIFKHLPGSTADWNALQAITYSGATR